MATNANLTSSVVYNTWPHDGGDITDTNVCLLIINKTEQISNSNGASM